MNKKMSNLSRIVTIISSIAFLGVLVLPIWKIRLIAPQYPEGLVMKIWANKLTGDVDIINGLNHYIGMRTLHNEDFIEFKILPAIIIGYSLLGFIVFFVRSRIFFRFYAILFMIIALISIADFYRWEYDYGHDLDPKAPIQVPGMSYQPPLIGSKQLLNFTAYSFPDTGGLVFAACGLLIVGVAAYEWINQKKNIRLSKESVVSVTAFLFFSLTGCSQSPQPIQYGQDECDYCKMTIMNPKFASELVTKKGKAIKFDDLSCMANHLNEKITLTENISNLYVTDFSEPHSFIPIEEAHLLASENFRSPMRGNVAAFSHTDSLKAVQQVMGARKVSWEEAKDIF